MLLIGWAKKNTDAQMFPLLVTVLILYTLETFFSAHSFLFYKALKVASLVSQICTEQSLCGGFPVSQ